MRQRAADLAEKLAVARASVPGIGHNNPPEAVPPPPEALSSFDGLHASLERLGLEAASSHPEKAVAQTAVDTLVQALGAAAGLVGAKTDRFADAFATEAGKRSAQAFCVWLVAHQTEIRQLIDAAVAWLGRVP